MSANTKIEWADHTFNPWIGCTKVSPGCDNCYAEAREDKRLHRVQWGPGQPRHRTKTWGDPVKWNAQHAAFFAEHGRRQRVFCASLADVFDNEVPTDWRRDLFDLIERTPALDWLLLTKRIGNARAMLEECYFGRWADRVRANIWIGATIVNQEEADRDIPKLLAVPAAKRFLSMEPLLGPVDLERPRPGPDLDQGHGHMICQPWLIQSGIDWVIVGGESGPGARPMHPDWARSLRDQCEAAGVPFLFKQWGEWAQTAESPVHPEATRLPGNLCRVTRDGVTADHYVAISTNGGRRRYELRRVGKKAAGRLLDGRTWDGVPS